MIYDDLIGRAGLADIYDKSAGRPALELGRRACACTPAMSCLSWAIWPISSASAKAATPRTTCAISTSTTPTSATSFASSAPSTSSPKTSAATCWHPSRSPRGSPSTIKPRSPRSTWLAGVNPKLPYQYYLDVLRAMKQARPAAHLKAFTMIEIAQIQRIAKKPLEEIFADMKAAGLESLPGGGAEVFSDRVQGDLFWTKADSEEWLEIAQTGASSRLALQRHHALRPHRKYRREGLSPRATARSTGRDRRLPLLYPAFLFIPSAPNWSTCPGRRVVLDLKEIAVGRANARQLPPRQDLLDYEHH